MTNDLDRLCNEIEICYCGDKEPDEELIDSLKSKLESQLEKAEKYPKHIEALMQGFNKLEQQVKELQESFDLVSQGNAMVTEENQDLKEKLEIETIWHDEAESEILTLKNTIEKIKESARKQDIGFGREVIKEDTFKELLPDKGEKS